MLFSESRLFSPFSTPSFSSNCFYLNPHTSSSITCPQTCCPPCTPLLQLHPTWAQTSQQSTCACPGSLGKAVLAENVWLSLIVLDKMLLSAFFFFSFLFFLSRLNVQAEAILKKKIIKVRFWQTARVENFSSNHKSYKQLNTLQQDCPDSLTPALLLTFFLVCLQLELSTLGSVTVLSLAA